MHREGASGGSRRRLLAGALVAALAVLIAAWLIRSIDLPGIRDDGVPLVGSWEREQIPPLGTTCSVAGCSNGVGLTALNVVERWPRARRIKVCEQGECATGPVIGKRRGIAGVHLSRDWESSRIAEIELQIVARDGTVLKRAGYTGRTSHTYPNGRDCDEGCIWLGVVYNARDAEFHRKYTAAG